MGPRTSLDAVVKRKDPIIAPHRELKPGRQARSLVSKLTKLLYGL